jgi:Beta-lactamase class C and other penicillin binding proteins
MKTLRKGWMLLCVMIGVMVLSGAYPAAAKAPFSELQDMESFMDAVMEEQMQKHRIPNAAVSIVANGEVVLAKGYGYADIEKQEPVDPGKSLFRIGSTSKLLTWTAVMQLVEQGKLDLDTDVNQYLDFEIPAKLAGSSGKSEIKPVTLKHLLSHTAGFEDYSSDIFRLSEDQHASLEEYVRDYLPERIFPAGEVIAYSNYGTALAGYIVEQVSGMAFADYVEEYLYSPLNMEHSTFRQPLPDHLAGDMTKGYRYVDGEYRQGDFEYMPEPAGSMSSTASDMAQFMLAFLQGGTYKGKQILQERTVNQMLSPLFTPHERLNGMAHGFIEGKFNERRVLLHPGSTMLYHTALYLLPEEQAGLFITHSGGTFHSNIEAFQAFMDRYFPSGGEESLLPSEGMRERSEEYAGEYQQNRKSWTTSDKMLSLFTGVIRVQVDEEGYLTVTHMGETNRFIEIEPGLYYNLREGRSPDFGGDFRYIAFGTDPLGNTLLMTDGPMSYSKAAWHESSGVNIMLIAASILTVIGSLIYWGIKALVRRIRRSYNGGEPSKVERAAKYTAVAYGLLTIVFVLEFIVLGEPHPVYQLPAAAYGDMPAWSVVTELVPYAMACLGLGVVLLAVAAWRRSRWRIIGRIHYTWFAGATVILLWIFQFWNLI